MARLVVELFAAIMMMALEALLGALKVTLWVLGWIFGLGQSVAHKWRARRKVS